MAAIIVLVIIMVLSLLVALWSRRGRNVNKLDEFMVGGRSFGPFLLYFLLVGETYSIGTMIGFPGGIYAKGASYGIWFIGYILLGFAFGYFIRPLLWRAAKRYSAMTGPDLFRQHFASRGLELLVVVSSIIFLVPWGQLQFTGMVATFQALNWHLNSITTVVIAGAIAFAYIAIAGMRAPAFVSLLKDFFMLTGILVVGIVAAVSMHGTSHLFRVAVIRGASMTMTGSAGVFAITTIVYQALGFGLSPFGLQALFSGKSEAVVKKSQTLMPLYMLMYPFLVIASYYMLIVAPHLKKPNEVFMIATVHLLPSWAVGAVAAGAVLSAVLVLSMVCLAIGSMVSRNVVVGLNPKQTRKWTQIVIFFYLMISMAITVLDPKLMLTLINTSYYGTVQLLPGLLAILFARRISATAVGSGIVVGDGLALTMYFAKTHLFGINVGLLALLTNFFVMYTVSRLTSYEPDNIAPVGIAVQPRDSRSHGF